MQTNRIKKTAPYFADIHGVVRFYTVVLSIYWGLDRKGFFSFPDISFHMEGAQLVANHWLSLCLPSSVGKSGRKNWMFASGSSFCLWGMSQPQRTQALTCFSKDSLCLRTHLRPMLLHVQNLEAHLPANTSCTL